MKVYDIELTKAASPDSFDTLVQLRVRLANNESEQFSALARMSTITFPLGYEAGRLAKGLRELADHLEKQQ